MRTTQILSTTLPGKATYFKRRLSREAGISSYITRALEIHDTAAEQSAGPFFLASGTIVKNGAEEKVLFRPGANESFC